MELMTRSSESKEENREGKKKYATIIPIDDEACAVGKQAKIDSSSTTTEKCRRAIDQIQDRPK